MGPDAVEGRMRRLEWRAPADCHGERNNAISSFHLSCTRLPGAPENNLDGTRVSPLYRPGYLIIKIPVSVKYRRDLLLSSFGISIQC